MTDTTLATTESSTPTYGCDCIELSNKPDGVLARHNTQIDVSWEVDRKTGKTIERVALQTSLITKKRGARPKNVLPNYCPFCGSRYVAPTAGTP